jgi:ribosomal protein RSM22 (predicted rRNA methylase)
LDEAVSAWLAGRGSLVAAAADLSKRYARGETSREVSLAAYVAARLPATFAANLKVQAALQEALPNLLPATVLDIGAGPGTAGWAALKAWPSLQSVTQVEQDEGFAELARTLNAASGIAALREATLRTESEGTLPKDVTADLVVASYVLAELPLETMQTVGKRLWARAHHALLLVEPGTPQGFARLRAIREMLAGHVIAPCTHHAACPMQGEDWCHFKTRLPRSRQHMQAKQARVPFEDEAFSYLILARLPAAKAGARTLAPPITTKAGVTLRLCADGAITNTTIASRDKATYKRAKRMTWGQVWE